MLLRFGARNILSFKEGFEVSFSLGPGCPKQVSKGKTVSPVLCLKGPNASGKSNVMKTLTFISEFCCNSFNSKPDDTIEIIPFADHTDESTFLFAEFVIDEITYTYELEVTPHGVEKETLKKKKSRTVDILRREKNSVVYCSKELQELKKIKMRTNVSVISMAHQFAVESTRGIYDFFAHMVSNIDSMFGERKQFDSPDEISAVSRAYSKSKDLLDFVTSRLSDFDTGIDGITFQEFSTPDERKHFLPIFGHTSSNAHFGIPSYLESNGTKALYSQLKLYKQVLDTGGILILDEFDTNLHPDILQPLVDLFTDDKMNPNQAQFIFTTHHTKIMDYLGKYRVVFVQKEDNESFLYRLDELPGDLLRNDRSIEGVYNSGKIGGRPKL
jgi:AAA15 family ATPase/GTPase